MALLKPLDDPDGMYEFAMRVLPGCGQLLAYECDEFSIAVGMDVDQNTGEELGIRIVLVDHVKEEYFLSPIFESEEIAISTAETMAARADHRLLLSDGWEIA